MATERRKIAKLAARQSRRPRDRTAEEIRNNPKTRGERVIAFIEQYCIVPEGKLVGKPLRLDPFQKSFILAVYDNNVPTLRAYLSLARKNGKTALIAGICLAHILGPEAVLNTQIISGARSRDQAALVFKLMVKMISLSDELRPLARSIPSSKTIIGLRLNVEFISIAAEAKTAHGLSPVVAILDEVGQVEGPQDDFVDAIETAQGAHDNPILFAISTQARTDADLFSIWLDDAKNSGDPSIVSHVYSAHKDAKLDDESEWLAANPAMGTFRSYADLKALATKAQRMPSFEATFRNLNMNQRVNVNNPFVSRNVWLACGGEVDMSAFERFPVYAGLDLSARADLTALVLTCEDDDGIVHMASYFWTPLDTLGERARHDRAPYDVWVKQGFIRAVAGKSIDYETVTRHIVEILAPMEVGGVAFDRWRIDILLKELERIHAELPLVEFGQGFKDMSPALDAFEEKLLNGELRHGGNPVLTMCAVNATVESDPAANRKLTKSKSSGRIDGMVAGAMAFGVMIRSEEVGEPLAVDLEL